MKTSLFRRITWSKKSQPTSKRTLRPSSASASPFFQSSLTGNHGVHAEPSQTFFQPKLAVSQPGDKYEQEADAVADKVTTHQSAKPVLQQQAIMPVQKADLQTKESVQRQPEKEEEEPVQMKEKEEEEKAVQMQAEEEEEPVQMQEKEEPEEPVQMQEKEEEEEPVQAKGAGDIRMSGSDFVSRQLQTRNSNGSPLPTELRAGMETKFGSDFSDVKIHTDAQSIAMNQAIHAQAFTHGRNIYFNEGYFAPYSLTGQHLMAHELTHVIQQQGGKSQQGITPSTPHAQRRLELDASNQPTGNYIFERSGDLPAAFIQKIRQAVADGTVTDDELNKARLYSIVQRGSVTQIERLLMAAALEPANHAAIRAFTGNSITLPVSQITEANRTHAMNVGRSTFPPEMQMAFLNAFIQIMQGNFDAGFQMLQDLNETALQEIMNLGGKSWQEQAENLSIYVETNHINPLMVLQAMYNGASDSSPADQVMAGVAYAVATQAGLAVAANIATGRIKVDALSQSAMRKITGHDGVEGMYVTVGVSDRTKSDTLYLLVSTDIFNVAHRGLIVHELQHAMDDEAVTTPADFPLIDFEITGYRRQVKYIMDQLLSMDEADRDAYIYQTRGMMETELFRWAYALEAKADMGRYEDIAKTIILQAPGMDEAGANRMLAMSAAALLAGLRTAILSMPEYSANATISMDGLQGETIL